MSKKGPFYEPSTGEIGTIIPMPVVSLSATKDYGLYMANKKTHKRYLRQHHLGKFKKNKAK